MIDIQRVREELTMEERAQMRRFSVRIGEAYHLVLERIASREGRSKTEVFKRALEQYAVHG
jgi:predicted transcriptional regulator|tara:strand:+ start:2147 stop:2329 length:183 start_codon:yes stop_codon:yes gene_type:complete